MYSAHPYFSLKSLGKKVCTYVIKYVYIFISLQSGKVFIDVKCYYFHYFIFINTIYYPEMFLFFLMH